MYTTHCLTHTHTHTQPTFPLLPPPSSYFNTQPNNFFPGITNGWFDTTVDGTYYHLRFFPQQTGMHAMRKMEDGELDMSGTGSPPWAVGVTRDMRMKAFYYVHG